MELMNQPTWLLPLTTIGLLTTIRLTLSFLRCLYVFFLRPPKNLKSYGSWAVVTGPTSGIGKAFSVELAKQGLNLLLIGRNPDKLSALSAALTSEFRVKTKTVLVDFSGDDLDGGVRRIEEAVVGLEVGVLINNAGVSDPTAWMVHEVVGMEEMVRVNVEGATRVAKAVLVGMVKRGRGAVVNLGSGSSVVLPSHPYYALYASTKAYIDQFSRSLYVEYKQMGIDVQCQVPLYIATKMTQKILLNDGQPSFFVPPPDVYARAALRWIGYEPRCMPYFPHHLQWCLLRLLPDFLLNEWRRRIAIYRRQHSQFDCTQNI